LNGRKKNYKSGLGMNKNLILRLLQSTVISALLVVAVISCKSSQPAFDPKDLSYLYNPMKNPINPRYNVINLSDDRSVFSVKFYATELFFSEANPQGVATASMSITAKLFNVSQGMVLADTANLIASIVKVQGKQEYIYDIPLKVEKGIEYVVEVKILDRLRSLVVQSFVPFNTMSYTNRYNFLAHGYFEKNPLFNPVVRANEFVDLVYLRKPIDSLYVSYYKPFKLIPDPPAMVLPEKAIDYGPDTTVALPYSDTLAMMFPKAGIYMCSVGRDIKEGYGFFNFGVTYPEMNTPEVMIEPLAYLATENEMNNMLSAPRPKFALDEFWIKCGGNVEKSRELIRIYYTRVLYSNFYFTSYKEGWRTERGMIYIIYGPPDKVYKNPEGESWGYRKPVIKSSWGTRYKVKEEYLYFNFKKKESIYSSNDYFLSRAETLVSYWSQAIIAWRKGIVFRLDNPDEI
jgi:GWxTD domain-containing protein